MNKEFLKEIKKTISEQKQIILSKQSELVDIDLSGDEVDEIQGKILANVQAQLSSRDRNKLKSIDIALAKIEEGTFGYCEECGDEIAEKRLIFNPIFINCVTCAEKIEAEQRKNRRM